MGHDRRRQGAAGLVQGAHQALHVRAVPGPSARDGGVELPEALRMLNLGQGRGVLRPRALGAEAGDQGPRGVVRGAQPALALRGGAGAAARGHRDHLRQAVHAALLRQPLDLLLLRLYDDRLRSWPHEVPAGAARWHLLLRRVCGHLRPALLPRRRPGGRGRGAGHPAQRGRDLQGQHGRKHADLHPRVEGYLRRLPLQPSRLDLQGGPGRRHRALAPADAPGAAHGEEGLRQELQQVPGLAELAHDVRLHGGHLQVRHLDVHGEQR
mmetsp:Transcript_49425/g.132252  ORF Transcript_49425/g.132252 Transcript_49425/m.132252 type:complete len:267 (-) Transcript_49425:298-1098(-)